MVCRAFGSEAQAHEAAAERKPPRGIACREFRRLDEGDVCGILGRARGEGESGDALCEGRRLIQRAQGYTQTCTYDFPDDVHKGLRARGTVQPARSFKLLIVGRCIRYTNLNAACNGLIEGRPYPPIDGETTAVARRNRRFVTDAEKFSRL